MQNDTSTAAQKLIVAGTAFCCSTAAFVLAAVMLVPAADSLLTWVGAPDLLTKAVVLLLLFGSPVVAAIAGISIGSKAIAPGVSDR